jgi:hypothetical protein
MRMTTLSMYLYLCALAGCAVERPTYLADGRQGHSIDCSGAALNWGYCERKAGELCQARGYDVVSAIGEQIPVAFQSASSRSQGTADARNTQLTSSSNAFGGASSIANRTLLVACR